MTAAPDPAEVHTLDESGYNCSCHARFSTRWEAAEHAGLPHGGPLAALASATEAPPVAGMGEILERFPDDVQDVRSRYVIVHQLRASADIMDSATKRETGWADTSDRAERMRKAADIIEKLAALTKPTPPASASSEQAYGSVRCQDCDGRGRIETGEMEDGVGGIGFATVDCAKCMGTGEITSDDHEAFGCKHGTDVDFRGGKQVVFFDYEGDGVFVWAFPYDTETDGQHCTEAERQSIHEQLWAWYLDWTSPSPEDDRCD